jgi:formiminoglutamase
MKDIFQITKRPDTNLIFRKNDPNDVRMGEIVLTKIEDYEASEIIILGCPQDEGVGRNGGRTGAALAPDAIRAQFYKLTNFAIKVRIFDIGDTIIQNTLEETHEIHTQIVKQILKDGKKIIVLGGGNDISYADGRAMAEVFGCENWLGVNIDAHFDVRADFPPNSGTPYRQLLEENFIKPQNFCEFAWQEQVNSPLYFNYLEQKGVKLISLEKVRRTLNSNRQNLYLLLQTLIAESEEERKIFFGFDTDSVRAADAPGVSAPSPVGLTANEFIESARFAGENKQTQIIEFTEVNPNYDIDNRTVKLVAIAMHLFCSAQK